MYSYTADQSNPLRLKHVIIIIIFIKPYLDEECSTVLFGNFTSHLLIISSEDNNYELVVCGLKEQLSNLVLN